MPQSIFQQCPFEGGPAVYRAASLAELINDSITFEYDEVCSQGGFFRLNNNVVKNSEISATVIPNPTSETCKIILSDQISGFCSVLLYNSIGSEKLNINFDCKQRKYLLNVKDFISGVYLIKITVNNQKSIFCKLVILR